MKKTFTSVIALMALLALVLCGCGSQEPASTTAAAPVSSPEAAVPHPLGLADFRLTTTTWSSPNGATVNLTAAPSHYEEGQSASFIVRLEGEEVASVPCQWDGTSYTASAELNAEDGLCYYVLMTGQGGNTVEVAVNTPNVPTDEAIINLASSLNTYCTLMVESSSFADGKLTVQSGSLQIQTPKITNDGALITASEAELVLQLDGKAIATEKVSLTEPEIPGAYQQELSNIAFRIPQLEAEQELILSLNVTLSNGQVLSAAGSKFLVNDGQLLTTVG